MRGRRAPASSERLALRMGIVLVALGALLRLAAPFFMDLRMDGNTYAAMGHSWAQTRAFTMPWGDVTTWDCTWPAPSHHYPPLYPLYLGATYGALGFGLWQTKLAAVVIALVALAIIWATSAHLMGRAKAWLVTGLFAVEPHLVWTTGTGFSENLVILLFALTIWAIVKSLDDERFIILGGLFAGLSYLTRSSMGAFFVIAGFGGLAWRLYFRGWSALRSVNYWIAIVLFGASVFGWAARNVMLFGWPNWETSSYLAYAQEYAWAHPSLLLEGIAWKLPLFLFYVACYALPLWPEVRASWSRVREEKESAFWLALVLVVTIGWLLSSVFWTYEQYDVWWWDNHRYMLPAIVPLAWLALPHADIASRSFALRFGALGAALALVSLYLFVQPTENPETEAASALDADLRAGTQIGIEGIIVKYSFYPYITRHDVSVYGCRPTPTDACPGQSPDYIISLYPPAEKPGYSVLRTHTVHYPLKGEDWIGTVYKRDGPAPPGPRPPGCVLPATPA